MSESFDAEEIRYLLEQRWEKGGYENLLEEEQDFIVTWWLEAEASNGTLHQYFSNNTGDSAVEAHAALVRLDAPNAAGILAEAISMFGDTYPTDRQERNDALNSMPEQQEKDLYETLTDRLFDESENVQALALGRVADAYDRNGISDASPEGWTAKRLAASLMLAGIAILVVVLLVLLTHTGG